MPVHALFVRGIPDDQWIQILRQDAKGREWRIPGNSNFYPFFQNPGLVKTLLDLDTQSESHLNLPARLDLIVNEIAEPDTHHKTLAKLESLAAQLKCPVLNSPALIRLTTRDKIYQTLQGIEGLVVPVTLRCAPHSPGEIQAAMAAQGLKLPVIIREAGQHKGEKTFLVAAQETLNTLYALPLDGRDYYLTQYLECGQQGIYTKYRFVLIQGEIFIRHFRVADHWMIHGSNAAPYMNAHPEYIQQEKEILLQFETDIKPRLQPIASEIYRRLPLDYLGIDGTFDAQGQWIVFEVNACMNAMSNRFPDWQRWEKVVAKMRDAFIQRIYALAKV